MITTLLRIGLSAAVICGILALLNTQAYGQGSAKDLFVKVGCNKCHSVTAQKIDKVKGDDESGKQPPDLSHTGKDRNAAWIVGWLNRTEKLNGKVHKKKFSGSEADAKALANWLATLK